LEKSLANAQMISAQKDTLLTEVMSASQFIADLNTEIGKVRGMKVQANQVGKAGASEMRQSYEEQRKAVLERIKELSDRLATSETRLAASRKRVADMTSSGKEMSKQLAAFDSTITSFKSIVEGQRAEIASMNAQLAALKDQNTQLTGTNVELASAKATLEGEKARLTTERNTVYYVIGTKADLLKAHVIEQTGGTFGIGKTQIPALGLDPSNFTAIDKTMTAEIPLPKSNVPYHIVSRQNLAGLETPPDQHGQVSGSLKIKDADTFWGASKFLILIEQ
jgi:hypothetical protein